MHSVDAAGLPIGDEHPPRIMGVLNVSEESPYKASVFDEPAAAAEYVDEQLIEEGADIVDVGLESANKEFDVLTADQELERLDTALEAIESVSGDAVFSIETRYHEVAEAALDGGFDMVNDVCGFADPQMPEVCADHDVAVVKMASPPDLERPGAIADVDDIYDALSLNGFTEKTILDPAFGIWNEEKTLADDRETFHRLREFKGYGRPLLVSINRKNFLRTLAGRSTEAALPVSLAATSMAVERGANVIRTHDVAETKDAAIIGDAFTRDRARDESLGLTELDVPSSAAARRHLERIGAEADLANMAVIRTYEIRGLTDAEASTLSSIADSHDVVVTPSSTDTNLMFGTEQDLDSLSTALDGSKHSKLADIAKHLPAYS
jgi:dihydropteroate synthase